MGREATTKWTPRTVVFSTPPVRRKHHSGSEKVRSLQSPARWLSVRRRKVRLLRAMDAGCRSGVRLFPQEVPFVPGWKMVDGKVVAQTLSHSPLHSPRR